MESNDTPPTAAELLAKLRDYRKYRTMTAGDAGDWLFRNAPAIAAHLERLAEVEKERDDLVDKWNRVYVVAIKAVNLTRYPPCGPLELSELMALLVAERDELKEYNTRLLKSSDIFEKNSEGAAELFEENRRLKKELERAGRPGAGLTCKCGANEVIPHHRNCPHRIAPWASKCTIMPRGEKEWWVRFTDLNGIYHWLHSSGVWIGEPDQIDMQLFESQSAAWNAVCASKNAPPTWYEHWRDTTADRLSEAEKAQVERWRSLRYADYEHLREAVALIDRLAAQPGAAVAAGPVDDGELVDEAWLRACGGVPVVGPGGCIYHRFRVVDDCPDENEIYLLVHAPQDGEWPVDLVSVDDGERTGVGITGMWPKNRREFRMLCECLGIPIPAPPAEKPGEGAT